MIVRKCIQMLYAQRGQLKARQGRKEKGRALGDKANLISTSRFLLMKF